MREALQALLRSVLPELRAARGPVYARVVKVHAGSGRMSREHPRHSVDVQVLRRDLAEDPDWPVIQDVEVPVLWAGRNRGVFCLPQKGAVVRVGFLYGDPNMPYVEAPAGFGFDAPEHPDSRLLIVAGSTRIEVRDDGRVVIQGKGLTADGLAGAAELTAATVTVSAAGTVRIDGAAVELGGALYPVLLQGPGGPQPSAKVRGI